MRSWRPWAFALGVVIALAGLAAGVYFNQSNISLVAVLVALFTALSPTVVPSLSDEIQGNNSRYERHREYFANVILPMVGSMELVDAHSIRLLEPDRRGWKLGGSSGPTSFLPGAGEKRIPAYEDVFLPHLEGRNPGPVWRRMQLHWSAALEAVGTFTTARVAFDAEFLRRMDALVHEKIRADFVQSWDDSRGAHGQERQPRYQAAQIRDTVEYWFQGMYGRPGWQWIGPQAASGSALGGADWAVTSGGSSMVFLWGGPIPDDLPSLSAGMAEVIDRLKDDSGLKELYETSARAEAAAHRTLAPLFAAASDAAELLKHGPDIPVMLVLRLMAPAVLRGRERGAPEVGWDVDSCLCWDVRP